MTNYPRYPITLASFPGWKLGRDPNVLSGGFLPDNDGHAVILKNEVTVGYRTGPGPDFEYHCDVDHPEAKRLVEEFGRAATREYDRRGRAYKSDLNAQFRASKAKKDAQILRVLGLEP